MSRAGSRDQASQPPADPATVNAIRKVSQALESIPEKEFTSDDHFARGLDDLLANRFDSALLSFEKALENAKTESLLPKRHIWLMFSRAFTLAELGRSEEAIAVYDEIDRRYGKDDSLALREWVATVLFNKGVALAHLGRSEGAIIVYDEIDRRYGKDDSLALRERVATALTARAFTRILQAKQDWQAETERRQLLALAIGDLHCTQRQCAEADRAMVLGNLGYALFLSGEADQAEEPTRECLRLGGWESLQGQQDDAQRQRVEPLDAEYEKLLDRLWDELHPRT